MLQQSALGKICGDLVNVKLKEPMEMLSSS